MYLQSEQTKYWNNEFDNMPSIDCSTANETTIRIDTDHVDLIDWKKVKDICNKYNLDYTIISDTFCSYGHVGNYKKDFILYYKLDITEEEYQALRKNGNYEEIRKIYINETNRILNLHNCVHELDEETLLYFNTGWSGNVGLFGSHDVKRKTYSHCDTFTSWASILDWWHPSIHDTLSHLRKGVYVMCTTSDYKNIQ